MKKQIYVFICENQESAKEIINKYFDRENVTFAELFDEDKREKITEALRLLED